MGGLAKLLVPDDLWAAIAPLRDRFEMGYNYRRRACRIARRGVESSRRLGRHRWVVERTHAWLNCMRRLTMRYERRADIYQIFTTLGCALVCLRQIRRFHWVL